MDEEFAIVRCEKVGDNKYKCKYGDEEFEVDVGERREEIELLVPKDKGDIKELVKMMLEIDDANKEDSI